MTAPASLSIDIAFECEHWPGPQALEARARDMMGRVWSGHGEAAACEAAACDVALLFACDDRVQELNRSFRGYNKPTNVLSFPAGEGFPADLPSRPLGDIILAYETTAREAAEAGCSLEAHTAHLVVHGFLHLLGYDHQDDSQATEMELEETRIMAEAGFDDPYRLADHV